MSDTRMPGPTGPNPQGSQTGSGYSGSQANDAMRRTADEARAAAGTLREEAAGAAEDIKKEGAERLKDGSIAKNPQRMGPLTLAARSMALERVLGMQAECNAAALAAGRPQISLIDAEEEARIRHLIDAQTWPDGWDGDEPSAETIQPVIYQNGAVQPLLFGAED